MKEAMFKISDRVAKDTGGTGVVMEAIYSARNEAWLYEVVDDKTHDVGTFRESNLKAAPEKKYSMKISIDIAENVVIASLYEVCDPNMRPVAKGHGHIIHEGELGIAQAASYACMKLYKSMGGAKK